MKDKIIQYDVALPPEFIDEIKIGRYSRTLNNVSYPQQAITASYDALNYDEVIFADATSGAITVTLPKGASGQRFSVIKIDSSANAVTVTGAENINGGNVSLSSQYDKTMVQFTGTEWIAI